jgi:hypothetical protein
MKYQRDSRLFAAILIIMLLALVGCSNGSDVVILQNSAASSGVAPPVVQQTLPKGLFKSNYPVIDWVFNRTCRLAVDSYNQSPMNTTLAYDSAAWVYPDDGHLVEGTQECDKDTLLQQARNLGLPTLLTVGIDGSWSTQDAAQYIDRASSQPQIPCTAGATTYICNIVNWAVTGGYTGVIIDFELVQWNYPDIRTKFGTFMQKLQNALHQKGLLCGIALIPKVSDNAAQDPLYKLDNFEDWKLLGDLDFLIDMVLNVDLQAGKPGPITSVAWIEKQVDYIWQTIPQAMSKFIFEFPLYGREWQKNASGNWSIANDETTCQQVSVQKASQSLLPDVSHDPTAPEIAWNDSDGNRHEEWYSTASSLVAIMTQVQGKVRGLLQDPNYKLPTSFWYRGAECSNFFGAGNALEAFYNG